MKQLTTFLSIAMIISIIHLLGSCEAFLEQKPDQSIVVPTTLDDFEAILNNDRQVFNLSPGIGEIASADYYTTYDTWLTFNTASERNAYIWADDTYQGETSYDWNRPYEQVFYANIVLDGLAKNDFQDGERVDRIRGTALFHRAWAYHHLLELFAPAYAIADLDTKVLPIQYDVDVNEGKQLYSHEEVIRHMLDNLEESLSLLPENPLFKTQPGKQAVYALLSRVYLNMGNYRVALEYCERALQLGDRLMDYNEFSPNASRPFPLFNEEVIFQSALNNYHYYNSSYVFVAPELYALYGEGDLRKKLFFTDLGTGGMNFKGKYTGQSTWFSGLATDELYLIKAECLVRTGRLEDAESLMETFLAHRMENGEVSPLVFTDTGAALEKVLEERRKELLFRGIRWMDLKRLNGEGAEINLERNLNGQVYSLSPNSPGYVFKLPPEEVQR